MTSLFSRTGVYPKPVVKNERGNRYDLLLHDQKPFIRHAFFRCVQGLGPSTNDERTRTWRGPGQSHRPNLF
jgi:hypothetical protein